MAKRQNHLIHLLDYWYTKKDEMQWVLATIVGTEGSSYRKSGAMMLIDSLGHYHGMLSGGCLESDIMRQARRCWDDNKNHIVQYDMREEEDLAWQLGIGCGGLVKILLQPVTADNQYLFLPELLYRTRNFRTSMYQQVVDQNFPNNRLFEYPNEQLVATDKQAALSIFQHIIKPTPHVAVFGGGADARPMVEIMSTLGWFVTLVDPRPSYARQSEFPGASVLIKSEIDSLVEQDWLSTVDAVIIMSHNIKIDGQALALVQKSAAKFVGLLGPTHRTDRVLKEVCLTREMLKKPLANPMGLRLGGELPESIALSAIAEIHAYLENSDGLSISDMLIR
jgi:xanthine/CO dehydrogenase XdhC/CoxF family maturation factor